LDRKSPIGKATILILFGEIKNVLIVTRSDFYFVPLDLTESTSSTTQKIVERTLL